MPAYVWWLWLTPNVLCALALAIGIRRKFLHTLPWFFRSLGYLVVQAAGGVAAIHSPIVFHWFALIAGFASSLLEVVMIYELASKLILSRSSLAPSLRRLSSWTMAALVLLATVAAALFYPQMGRAVMTMSLSTNLIAFGLLLTLLLVTRVVGICWGSLPAGVALGLGISAMGELAGAVLEGRPSTMILGDNLRLISWDVCVLVWLVYLLLPQRPVSISQVGMQSLKSDFDPGGLLRVF